jgi:hypothetical protein
VSFVVEKNILGSSWWVEEVRVYHEGVELQELS